VPAAAIVGEAMVALVLADACLERFGGDSVDELRHRYAEWQRQIDERFTRPRRESARP
jgi:chorismate synthase